MNKKQTGFALVESLLIILILAVIGFGGCYIWYHQNASSKRGSNTVSSTSTTADPYAGWKTYTDDAKTFTIRYPSSWSVFNSSGLDHGSTIDGVGVGPAGNNTLITVSSFATSQTPKDFEGQSQAVNSSDLVINGNTAFYEETTDSKTYTDLTYAIGKTGHIITVDMTKTSNIPTLPPQDNSQYIATFDLIAKSVQLK